MSNREIRWIDTSTQSHDRLDLRLNPNKLAEEVSPRKQTSNREIRWVNIGNQSHNLSDLGGKLGGFIGSNVLIAHRTKASDTILYNSLLENAIKNKSTVIIPHKEFIPLPGSFTTINIKSEKIEKRRVFKEGTIYRLLLDSYEQDAPRLNLLYEHLLSIRKHAFSFVIIFDTLKKWSPLLEDHIRFLLRESPSVQGSVWLHCPLSNIPQDLFTVFGDVMVIWPSQHEIDLLNSHFPAETILLSNSNTDDKCNNKLLLFNSKPISKRGWEWHRYP
jgi:hypothetical protein